MATELAAKLEVVPAAETEAAPRRLPLAGIWSSLWPKLAPILLGLTAWQLIVWSGGKPDYVLPRPLPGLPRLTQDLANPDLDLRLGVTLRRAPLWDAIAGA